MKKLLDEFKVLYNKIDMEAAGISSAGFLSWEEEKKEGKMMKVGFICNAGLGSSAMGATLFRKKMREMGVEGVDVRAYPADQIPEDLTLAVCQKDFMEMTGIALKTQKICTVDDLLSRSEYAAIVREIMALQDGGK